jgi:hypothetical protein
VSGAQPLYLSRGGGAATPGRRIRDALATHPRRPGAEASRYCGVGSRRQSGSAPDAGSPRPRRTERAAPPGRRRRSGGGRRGDRGSAAAHRRCAPGAARHGMRADPVTVAAKNMSLIPVGTSGKLQLTVTYPRPNQAAALATTLARDVDGGGQPGHAPAAAPIRSWQLIAGGRAGRALHGDDGHLGGAGAAQCPLPLRGAGRPPGRGGGDRRARRSVSRDSPCSPCSSCSRT